jgi:hypothetical protein
MNSLIAHVVIASLALFTLPDGPADKPLAPPATKAAEPVKGGSAPTAGDQVKGQAPVKVARPGPAVEPATVEAKKTAAPAKAADVKPCEPVKPCSVD